MNIREATALALLYRACPDEALRAKVRGWIPEVVDLAGSPAPGEIEDDKNLSFKSVALAHEYASKKLKSLNEAAKRVENYDDYCPLMKGGRCGRTYRYWGLAEPLCENVVCPKGLKRVLPA